MQFLKALRSLRGKIILLCCGIAFVASILVGGLNYYRTLDITLNAATESLAAETRLMGLRFQSAYDTVRNEVSIVSRTPPIQGLVRSIANNGVDPKDGSTTELWRKRLEEIFISVKQENPYYTQMRYIGLADEGRELVRVNRADDNFYPVPIHELQQKAIEPYVQAVLQGRDTFFFSKVTLNREHGKIDEELIPTIRAVMPVKDVASDKLYGLLVINMAFEALMKRMFNVAKPTKHSFVTNQLGDYIEYDPQTGDLHFEYHDRITKKQPEFIKKIQEGMLNKTLQGDEALFEEGEDFIYYVRMGIDKSTDTEYVGAILRVPRDELLAGVRKTRRETILLTIALVIASIFVAALIAHKLTGPLVQMTRNISKIEDSNKDLDLPVAFQDEIGELARAFQETITRLTRSEATRQAYVDASGDGYWDWMIQQDYEYMSPRFWEMLGYNPEEKKHKPSEWQELIFEDDLNEVLENYNKHIETKGEHPFSQEVRYHHKDGSTITVFCKGEVVEWAEDGTPIRMIGTHTDLTQFKKAEEQLRLLQLAVDHSKDLVLVTEPNVDNPIIVYASKASKEMCGYEPEELIGQTPSILQGKKTDRTQLDALKNALKKQEPFITELINYAKDGREYWTNLSIVPVKDAQGNTTHFAAIKHDVTKKKAAEAEREKLIRALELSNKELDEFAYVASHDLKAPLRVIDNASRWLEQDLEEYLNDDTRESMELLRNRVSRMEKLLDDLLEYSRIGRKVDGSYGEIISGDALGKDIVQLLSPPKSFSVQFSPEFNSIKLPRMPLQHVLLNLISNAIKHHDKDKGSIEVNIRDEGSRYVFTVTDDGPGIAPEFQEQVFNMFQTLKPRDQVEGSGMGLAMVKKHIEHFGGTITLESEEGQGATFRFIWPKEQLQVNQ